QLTGTIRVDVHYYEDGNVRLTTTKRVSETNVPGGKAGDVIREIAKVEKRYHEELNRGFSELSESSFKGLRRQLPVTRQKVEWEKVGSYRAGREVGAEHQCNVHLMSRHKLVKALDIDDELDDFDGAAEDDFEDELTPEGRELLRTGIIEVRQTLGTDFPATNQEIEDSLYYYYYNVQKTVNYLLSMDVYSLQHAHNLSLTDTDQKTNINSQKPKKDQLDPYAKPPTGKPEFSILLASKQDHPLSAHLHTLSPSRGLFGSTDPPLFSEPLSAADFFKDSPWLNVPRYRQAQILVEPCYPPGRLLGGSSRQEGGPPKSKLAALAAARRKEHHTAKNVHSSTSSVALLDKLNLKSDSPDSALLHNQDSTNKRIPQKTPDPNPRKYVSRQRRSPTPPHTDSQSRLTTSPAEAQNTAEITQAMIIPIASPSLFAKAMFGRPPPEPHHVTCLDPSRLLAMPSNEMNANGDAFADPSPDDVVLRSQSSSKGGKQAKSPAVHLKDSNVKTITQGVKEVNVAAELPKTRSKNLDVVTEYSRTKSKNAANFVVIGHVDAGKSTLMGRLLQDLKVVEKRTVDKYRKEAEKMGKASFALAWVLDQGTEERERGVTIDIASQKFETEKTIFTILDAPGHRDFIPNMIAGASQADFAVLVIDASTGNFESGLKGQTKEHALLVRSIGVQRVVIAVNKLDTVEWSQQRFDEISQQVSAFLTATGFLAKNVSFVPCSGLTGDNIVNKASDPLAAWYTGPPLISLLESSEPITRAIEKPLRLIIDDIFRGGVQNPISISGRIDAGTVQIGDTVLAMPGDETATIKGLEVDREPAEWAVAGQNVVLHLTNIEAKHLRSGDVICPPSAPIHCLKSFTVKLLAFEHIMPMHCEIHKGRLHAPGRVSALEAILDKASGAVVKGKKPKLVKPGSVARVKVEMEDAIPLENGSKVILRAGGETIGAGLVE
ncbi:MAG: hypothetical protein Q9163_001045, partial [Psora crenata]